MIVESKKVVKDRMGATDNSQLYPPTPEAELSNSAAHPAKFAAIDLGTNTCRLLIAKPYRNSFTVLDAFSRAVRLGGDFENNLLAPEAIIRTLSALRICASKVSHHGVTHIRAVATEAYRRARNSDEFLREVKKQTGLNLEIITAAEEAELALDGCRELITDSSDNILLFDIGGGSTQIIWQRGKPPAQVLSIPFGVVALAKLFTELPSHPTRYVELIADVTQHLKAFDAQHGIADALNKGSIQMVGTSGTVTTLASVARGLTFYDRNKIDGIFLDTADAIQIGRKLSEMSVEERAGYSCIGKRRADLVVGGCAIFEAICTTWPVKKLRVADRGVREGVLLNLMTKHGAFSKDSWAH